MPKNDREVFEKFVSEQGTSLTIDFLTYAVFAHEKSEWIKLWEARSGNSSPTQEDIDNWIENLTDSQFSSMRNEAGNFFLEAADVYLEEKLKVEREAILRSAIVREIKASSVWWKQLAMALMTAIVAPLLLGGVIAAGYFYSSYFTPAAIAHRLAPGVPADATSPAPAAK